MKLNLATVLKGLKGEPLQNGTASFTLSEAFCTVLLAPFPDEASLSGEEKNKRFKLAMQVVAGGEQDISLEDVVLLKKLIGKGFPPLIVGRVYEILDA